MSNGMRKWDRYESESEEGVRDSKGYEVKDTRVKRNENEKRGREEKKKWKRSERKRKQMRMRIKRRRSKMEAKE